MDPTELGEVSRRISLSEACRLYKYRDTVRDAAHPHGVITFAWGWNYERSDTQAAIVKVGGDWGHVSAAPIAIDSEPANAVAACLTQPQADALIQIAIEPVIGQARASLADGIFDALDPVRRFVVTDLTYNLGEAGWLEFNGTRGLINQAQLLKAQPGKLVQAHTLFMEAAQHLQAAPWYSQTGERAMRNVAMMRVGEWCSATGNGSDIA